MDIVDTDNVLGPTQENECKHGLVSGPSENIERSSAKTSVTETDHSKLWYVIHSKPRQETIALDNLERQGYECYLPMARIEKIRRHKAIVIDEPMFPRYLFIRLGHSLVGQGWAPIRSTLGVAQLVHFGGEPARMTDELVDFLRTREQSLVTRTLFSPGEPVTITEGPFVGIQAIYQIAGGQQRSIILLEILNRQTPKRVETAKLRRFG